MYPKFIVAGDKITYKALHDPLNENYIEAAEFVREIFNIENNIVVPVDNNKLSCVIFNTLSLVAPLFMGIGLAELNVPLFFVGTAVLAANIIQYRDYASQYHRTAAREGYIRIARESDNTETIIHETVHYLADVKIIPKATDSWASRAVEIIFKLLKWQAAGESMEFFEYPAGQFPYSEYEGEYFDRGYIYYQLLKQNINTEALTIAEFNKIYKTENYHLGAFVGGIVKGILENKRDIEQVKLFIHKLTARVPLEAVVREFL